MARMETPPGYRQLRVWQTAMDLTDAVYDLTKRLPSDERFNLVSQMQRAAVSIPSNIAEGHGRASRGDYRRHVSIARGSLMELETQIEICVRRGYITREEIRPTWTHCNAVGKMLTQLLKHLSPPSA